MKGIFLVIVIMFLGIALKAQQYILVENHGRIHFFDYQSAKYECATFRIPRDHILAEDICGYCFVGYAWERDSLTLYLEKEGILTEKKVLPDLNISIPRRVTLKGSNLMSYYRQLEDPNAVYRCDDLVIKVRDRGHVICYKGDSLLWEKSPLVRSFGIGMSGLGYQKPVISQNKKNLLFQYATCFKHYLVEIDMLTGKETKIARNASGTSYSYSPDGNYILYHSRNHRFVVYDKMNRKKITPIEWRNAFWFYR